MALTPLYNTGFETGLASSAGNGLGRSGGGSIAPQVVAGAARNGAYGLRIANTFGNTSTWISPPGSATGSPLIRFAFRCSAAPSGGSFTRQLLAAFGGSSFPASVFLTTSGAIEVQVDGGLEVTGPTICDGAWHVLEFRFSDGAGTLDWRVDGSAQTQATGSGSGGAAVVMLGQNGGSDPAYTGDYDDLVIGTWTTTSDWWGDGKGEFCLPSSTFNGALAANFANGDTGGTLPPATVTFVDDVPPWPTTRSSTDNVRQGIASNADSAWAGVKCDTAETSGSANAVQALIAHSAVSGGGTSNHGAAVNNSAAGGTADGIQTTILAKGTITVEASMAYDGAQALKPAAGWTVTEVEGVVVKWGFCADISPTPTVQAMALEVDWPVASGPVTHSRSASITAASSIAVAPQKVLHRAIDTLTTSSIVSAGGRVIAVHERSASLTNASSVQAAPQRVLHRSAAVGAASLVTTTGQRAHQRSAAISGASSIATAGQRAHLRSAAFSAASSIGSSGTVSPGFTVHERSASFTGASSVVAAGVGFSIVERSASFTAVSSIVTARLRVHVRSAAISSASSVQAAQQRVLMRSAAIAGTSSITTVGDVTAVISRSAQLTAASSIATTGQRALQRGVSITGASSMSVAYTRDHLRAVSIGVVSSIDARPQVQGLVTRSASFTTTSTVTAVGRRALNRSAQIAAASDIAVAAEVIAIIERAVSIVASSMITTERELVAMRSAALASVTSVDVAYTRELMRAVTITGAAQVAIRGIVQALITPALRVIVGDERVTDMRVGDQRVTDLLVGDDRVTNLEQGATKEPLG